MKVAILPGSFKPPHIGHFNMLEQLLHSKISYDFIYIYISSKPRPLQPNLYLFSKMNSHNMFHSLLPFDSSLSPNFTKKEYTNTYKQLVEKRIIPTIDAKQSLEIWNIYLHSLQKKYPKLFEKTKVEIAIATAPSPLLSSYSRVDKLIRHNMKPSNIHLIKSKKNQENTRFDFLLKKYPSIHIKILSSKYPKFHSTLLRKAILDKNEKEVIQYLPSILSSPDKKKIWKILSPSSSPKSLQYKEKKSIRGKD
jgi:nicotinamide mononucleotide adenylyltransferase